MLLRAKIKTQRGVGLIEVMVSMFVLGIAVVGFSALQIRALTATHDAMFKTQAMSIAQEMGERIRLNPAGSDTYKTGWADAKTAMTNYKCETTACSAEEMAKYDLKTMTELAESALPNGKIAVLQCIDRLNYCVYVAWNETKVTKGTSADKACSANDDTYNDSADCIKLETSLL